jgi:hypothetical protein
MNYTKLRKTLGLNVIKTLGLCLTLTASAVLPMRSYAVASLADAQLASADATATAGSVFGGANVVNAVNLFFTGKKQNGTGVTTSTGAYVTISATAMTFYQPFGTVDASVGTAGVITYASTLPSNTMGSLCDYLGTLGASYRCILQGAQRADQPVILKTQTSTNLTGNLQAAGGLSVLQATTTFVSLGINPGAGRRVVLKQCITRGEATTGGGAASDLGFQVSGQLRKFGVIASPAAVDQYGVAANDSYNVFIASPAAATATYYPTQYAVQPWIEFAQGAHVVVRQGTAGSTTVELGSDYVTCSWDEK